ncbi:MAG: cytochrome C biogenesis protein [Chloroflexi bacterium CFX1]|nr:cytochrome C biogenesis protein [Chloroflexi bacterium CFX1]
MVNRTIPISNLQSPISNHQSTPCLLPPFSKPCLPLRAKTLRRSFVRANYSPPCWSFPCWSFSSSTLTAGVLWTTFAFAGTLGLNRSMAVEKDRGCMDGLLLAPVDRSAIFFGKALSNLAFMLIVEIIVVPMYALLYNETRIFQWEFVGVLLLGSIGYISVGTLLSAMSAQTRTRDVLLPILLFPVAVPVLLASVKASGAVVAGLPLEDYLTPLNLLIVYDVVFLAVSYMIFDFVVEE